MAFADVLDLTAEIKEDLIPISLFFTLLGCVSFITAYFQVRYFTLNLCVFLL